MLGALRCLQRLGENHHIKLIAGKEREALVNIGPDDIDMSSKAMSNKLMVDFCAIAEAIFMGL
jgi:hypothetical protein